VAIALLVSQVVSCSASWPRDVTFELPASLSGSKLTGRDLCHLGVYSDLPNGVFTFNTLCVHAVMPAGIDIED